MREKRGFVSGILRKTPLKKYQNFFRGIPVVGGLLDRERNDMEYDDTWEYYNGDQFEKNSSS